MAIRVRIFAVSILAAALTAAVCAPTSVWADSGPVIVIPGKPGVPVIINGRDVSWAVVYGDWGLAKPGRGSIIIDGGGPIYPTLLPGGYFPAQGRPPAYGRQEIVPPAGRPRPKPAESFYRSWSTGSEPGPVTEYPPFDPPPVILAPRGQPARSQQSGQPTRGQQK